MRNRGKSQDMETNSKQSPIHIANRKQLFLDDLFFAQQQGITLALNPPVDAGEVFHADRPWENNGITSFCDLLPDPVAGHVKLYYLATETLPEDPEGKKDSRFRLCCAISEDGVRWEKPNLGVCEFQGSTDNNIVMQGDPNGPPHGFHEPGRVLAFSGHIRQTDSTGPSAMMGNLSARRCPIPRTWFSGTITWAGGSDIFGFGHQPDASAAWRLTISGPGRSWSPKTWSWNPTNWTSAMAQYTGQGA